MAKQLIGKKYEDMPEEYRNRITKEVFLDRQSDQRMAGDAIAAGGLDKFKNDAFKVDSLADFNFGAVGAGGAAGKGSSGLDDDDPDNNVYGRGRERFSRFDAKGLYKNGFSAQELWDYGMANDGKDDFIFGEKTKKFLQRKLNGGGTPPPTDPPPTDPPPTDPPPIDPPPTGGGTPPPVNQGPGSIYKGGNYQYFNDIGGDITDSFNKNSGTISINNGVWNAEINDNSRIYGGDTTNTTFNSMMDEPYDSDPQSPVNYDVPPQNQYFLDDWKQHFMARSRFGG